MHVHALELNMEIVWREGKKGKKGRNGNSIIEIRLMWEFTIPFFICIMTDISNCMKNVAVTFINHNQVVYQSHSIFLLAVFILKQKAQSMCIQMNHWAKLLDESWWFFSAYTCPEKWCAILSLFDKLSKFRDTRCKKNNVSINSFLKMTGK